MSREKPTRNELTLAVAGELYNVRVRPFNPADIAAVGSYAREAESKTRELATILMALVPHADNGGTLDYARELWAEYDGKYNKSEVAL